MSNDLAVDALCPYCNVMARYHVPWGWSLVYCDIEQGGCDQPIAIKAWRLPALCFVAPIQGAPFDYLSIEKSEALRAQKMAEQSHDDGERTETGPPPHPPLQIDIDRY